MGIINNFPILTKLFSEVNEAVDFTNAPSVAVPPASAVTHPAQLTELDPTTGRFALAGMELGDTGWRALQSADLLSGWTLAYGLIRRRGDLVQAYFEGLNGTAATDPDFYDLQSGFSLGLNRSMRNRGHVQYTSSDSTVHVFGLTNKLNWSSPVSYTTLTNGIVNITFYTVQSWPVSLPGIQESPPFSIS